MKNQITTLLGHVFAAVLFAIALNGCTTRSGSISLQLSPARSTIPIEDKRDPREVNGFGIGTGTVAVCTNHGKWNGIVESAFTPTRALFLQARLSAEFGERIKLITLKRFQNCYQINSISRAGGVAAISIAAASALDAATSRGPDFVLAHIEVLVDGDLFVATSAKQYQHVAGNPLALDFETKENTDANLAATQAAMGILIEKIRAAKK